MGIAEYNIRILVFHLMIIAGALWILLEGIQATRVKKLKIILIVLSIIVILALVFSLFANLTYHDKVSVSGKIIDISHTGSFAGALDSFSIRVEKADGTATWYHTSIFASSSFKASVRQLKMGDNINLFANNFFNIFYEYEIKNAV